MAKSGLGRGLGALLGDRGLSAPQPVTEKGERIEQIALDDLSPSPFQPRKHFSEDQLVELVASIRKQGIIQPLIVRPVAGRYELVAGERRWRAAQQIGLKTVPVIVRLASDHEVLELALVENLQRADLDPLEEAEAYALLIHQFKLTQEDVAQRVGKNRASIANAIRLLSLPEKLRQWIRSGKISVGHAKVILGINNADEQDIVAELVLKDGLNVRQTEKLVESLAVAPRAGSKKTKRREILDSTWSDLSKRLQQHLGTRVRLSGTPQTGKIELQFFSGDDLERLLKILGLPQH
jgi:ParB family chromosome partitioning protein